MSERGAMTSSFPDCPSEAVLDAYELGELTRTTVRFHIDGCSSCQARLQARQDAFRAMPGRDELVRAVHVAVAGVPKDERAKWRWLRRPLVGLAAGLAALMLLVVPMRDGPTTRTKGTVGLDVYVQRDGRVTRASSGDRFGAGDRLRFEVDLPTDAEIMIVGREASGRMYNAFPLGVDVVRSRPFGVGVDQLLPGAVVLNASVGRETLYLVSCETAFDSSRIEVYADGVHAPRGCWTTPFVLIKIAP